KTFLEQKKTANLEEIARHIQQDVDAVRPMLAHWIRKGKVVRLANPAGCGSSCQQCQPANAEVYGWIS
ncbi:MAG TPA: FeoC-like transcriptional regulator, partial [Coxiellaceae bacterium]|nr:FeoC-like transcriptional regulator [Coxiellaceae bacterium]